MVVRVDGQTSGEVGDPGHDLVHVHVGGGPGAGLEDINRKLVVVQAQRDLICRLGDGLGDLGIQHRQLDID